MSIPLGSILRINRLKLLEKIAPVDYVIELHVTAASRKLFNQTFQCLKLIPGGDLVCIEIPARAQSSNQLLQRQSTRQCPSTTHVRTAYQILDRKNLTE